jgi:hypothetical protein
MKYIYHHLGLGDHIICNGLVRYFKEIFGEISVFCKIHNAENVRYMFRDDPGIKIIEVVGDSQVDIYIYENKLQKDLIKVGFYFDASEKTFDKFFYKMANIPFEFRFSKFYYERNTIIEEEVFQKYNTDNSEYIFVHGQIDFSKVRDDLKIIINPLEYRIFDLLKLIENATEVHLMESSIKCLVNSYIFNKPKFFYHQYVRNYDDSLNSLGLNSFETIF